MIKEKMEFKRKVALSVIFMFTLMAIFSVVPLNQAFAQETANQTKSISPELAEVQKFGLLAAALAFGLGAIGAGIAIGYVGAAAMGAIAEKP